MKMNRKFKIVLGIILGSLLTLFIVLVVHIATAKPLVVDNATLQISRIDFQEPIDSVKAKEIHRNLKSIPGVKTDRLSKETGVLVFFHDIKVADSKTIYNKLMTMGNYKAKRFVLPKELENKTACPVMNENSFSYKFSRGIQRIFN
jgi:hypothetical protein